MRATSIGHAGILIETRTVSILCDPWFVPAFFGSWFVFPRNDQLSDDLLERIERADFLYVSHLHADHHDEPWLTTHLRREIPILLPGYPTREQQRTLEQIGFNNFVRTVDGVETEIAEGVTIAIHTETSITDGPGGDSALVVSADGARIVNQNDCRTADLEALGAHGPVDLHWLQYSGAIWYPMVYDMPVDLKRRLVDEKVESQFARAMRYVDALGARAVVPSAGPPVFLDDDLFHLNRITGDELSIFADQTSFMNRLESSGPDGILVIPGTEIEIANDAIDVSHPISHDDVAAIFDEKETYLRKYQADWRSWLTDLKSTWHPPTTDLIGTLQQWWQPLLEIAPTLRSAVGANCLISTGEDRLIIDFPAGEVREFNDDTYSFSFDIPRALVETVVAQRAVDWSNSLFLSCRWAGWREGDFNEYLYNFFKSLSVERMRRAEAEVLRKLNPPTITEAQIELGGYLMQRRCPHRNADLTVFGEIESGPNGDELVCTLHGWRFDCETGRCLTADEQPLEIRRA
jgi:UDP-MurNAc hydroxylase